MRSKLKRAISWGNSEHYASSSEGNVIYAKFLDRGNRRIMGMEAGRNSGRFPVHVSRSNQGNLYSQPGVKYGKESSYFNTFSSVFRHGYCELMYIKKQTTAVVCHYCASRMVLSEVPVEAPDEG